MKLFYYAQKDADDLGFKPKIGLYWVAVLKQPDLKKQNAYRKRIQFPQILQEQEYISIYVVFFKYTINFEIIFKERELEPIRRQL